MQQYVGIPAIPFDAERPRPPLTEPVTELPLSIGPGQVLTLAGAISGRYTLTCNGTQDQPCWILGTLSLRLLGEISIRGSWCYIDGITAVDSQGVHVGGDHMVIRHSDFSGLRSNRQMAGLGLSGTAIVAYDNTVHNFGDVQAADDQDAHGISVSRTSTGVWIIDNDCYENSGDGINVNPYPYDDAGLTAIRLVFIAGNRSFNNKQTGIWAKQSQDIIVSSNEVYGHKAGNSSYGQGIGYQYSTARFWALANDLHDNDVGIGVSEAYNDGRGPAAGAFFIGNTISRARGMGCGSGPLWSCAAIYLTGDAYSYVLNNAISNSIGGIHVMRGKGVAIAGTIGLQDEVVAGPDDPGYTPRVPMVDVAAYFESLYRLDIRSLTGGVVVPPLPPPTEPPVPPPPPTDTRPLCSTIANPLLRLLAFAFGRCRR